MEWKVVDQAGTSVLVSIPSQLASNSNLTYSVAGVEKKFRWDRTHRTLYLVEETSSGLVIEKPVQVNNLSLSQNPLNGATRVEVETSSITLKRTVAEVSPHVPGADSRAKAMGAKDVEIFSPITGKVLKVHCQEGEQVEEGQLLCVIEAMKMENKIIAPIEGIVEELQLKEMAAVESGSLLLKLARKKDSN